jgi:hypothetical protein
MSTQPQLLTLRSNTRYNCRLSVPPDYLRSHGLQPGDRVLWIPDSDGVRLKFVPPGELGQGAVCELTSSGEEVAA